MELLSQKPSRSWSRILNLVSQARSFELHAHRAGRMLQRRRELPQPNLGPFDWKLRKEHGEEPLRECFQQRAILRRADLDNPICYLRIVDRVVDVIRSRCRFSLALQFKSTANG